MSKRINVAKLLKSKSFKHYNENLQWGDNSIEVISVKDAKKTIKKIMEAVLDRAAEKAKVNTNSHCNEKEFDCSVIIDKQSILEIKKEIDYE